MVNKSVLEPKGSLNSLTQLGSLSVGGSLSNRCRFVPDLLHSLERQEPLHFRLQLLLDILGVCVLFESRVLHIEHPVDVVFMVARTPLTVHLLKVVEIVRVHFAEEPRPPRDCLLHCHEK